MDKLWMERALALADRGEQLGEVPIGAIITHEYQCVGQGFNAVIQSNDPSAHAEICALRAAGQHLNNYRLPGTTLYVTLAPCPMCFAAILNARVSKLVFGAYNLRYPDLYLTHQGKLEKKLQIVGPLLEPLCSEKLRAFFKKRRQAPCGDGAGSEAGLRKRLDYAKDDNYDSAVTRFNH